MTTDSPPAPSPEPAPAGRWRRLLQWALRRPVRAALAGVPLLMLAFVLVLIPFTPATDDLRKAKNEAPARVLSADGRLLAQFKRSNRQWVALSEISPHVVDALIATEDHRFYSHFGIDPVRTGGALLRTLGGQRQGGSTLTQQLARNLYPEDIGRAPTLTRKVKEAITALKIEAVYSKDEILETYLNTVPFLYNAWGIEMAARTYFDKPARRLDVLESATLIGMLKGTSYYNPVLNPQRALQRRNTVLAQMVRRGKLPAEREKQLARRPLRLDFERQPEPLGPAPHMAQHLRRWLIDWADRNGYDIHADGLVVRTTVDARLQEAAKAAVEQQGRRLQALADAQWGPRARWGVRRELVRALVRESSAFQAAREAGLDERQALERLLADTAFMRALREDKTRVQLGMMALEPGTGRVRAWVGSRDFTTDPFDHVQQARRQPGSTFKPFVYGAAFEGGARPSDTLPDEPVEIAMPDGTVWRPADASPPSGRAMSLREALALSKNTVTARLGQEVGASQVARLARAMGVRSSRLETVPSLALGTSPVTLREMVTAYGTLAAGGRYVEPQLVTRIEDSQGRVLEDFAPEAPRQVLSEAAAIQLVDVLRDAVSRGTGSAIRTRYGITADVAGKTGTTQDNADGWFILMHPQLVAGAWAGFNDSRITLGDDWGPGARSALPVVGEFFQQALRSRRIDPRARFADPPAEGVLEPLLDRLGEWIAGMFPSFGSAAPGPAAGRSAPPAAPATPRRAPAQDEPIPAVVAASPPRGTDSPPAAAAPAPMPGEPPPIPAVVAPAGALPPPGWPAGVALPPPPALPVEPPPIPGRVAAPGEQPPSAR